MDEAADERTRCKRNRTKVKKRRAKRPTYVCQHASDSELSSSDVEPNKEEPPARRKMQTLQSPARQYGTTNIPVAHASSTSSNESPVHEKEDSDLAVSRDRDNSGEESGSAESTTEDMELPIMNLEEPQADQELQQDQSESDEATSNADESDTTDSSDHTELGLSSSDRDSSESEFQAFQDESENDSDDDIISSQEDTSSSEEEDANFAEGDVPLYPGAPLTLHQSLMAILTLATLQRITGLLLGKILMLVALHCPANSVCKKTLYKFKKYFSKIGNSFLKFHYFCSNCVYPVPGKDSACPKCKRTENSFFIEVPLYNQLQTFFKRPLFFNDLQHRFRADRKLNAQNIEDIYDGRVYVDEVQNGFLSNPNSISMMIYTDGLQIFRSSSMSAWPIYLVINELEFSKRISSKNILLAGLWFGKCKPDPNIFLRPLKESMDIFSNTGYKFKLPDDSKITVKGKILCFTCDLPAKSKFLGFKQFNGFHGCPSCLAPGESYGTNRSSVHVYPYSDNYAARTHAQTKEFAQQAAENRKKDKNNYSVMGVKVLTWMYYLLPNIITCTAIDIMHGVFLGVCKLCVKLWFSSKYARQPWSMYHLIDEVENRIKMLRVPSYVQRFPRSLKDLALWKASEYKLFLLYFSIPVLQGLMEDRYLKHHCKLVSGIFLLSQDSVSPAQVDLARDLLNSYVAEFRELYSLRFMGINVHQLIHLPDLVLNLGPLWVYSCFFLESLNGEFARLVHGTRHVALQLCTSASLFLRIPVMIEMLPIDSAVYQFCKKLTKSSRCLKIAHQISGNTFSVGTYSRGVQQIQDSARLLLQSLQVNFTSINIFHRLLKGNIVYSSIDYSRKSNKTESTFVSFVRGDMPCLGRIVRFLRCSNCSPHCAPVCLECECFYYFVVQVYNREFWLAQDIPEVRLSFMTKVSSSNMFDAVPIEALRDLCFYTKVSEHDEFIAKPINTREKE